MVKNMTPKERVIAALTHKEPDMVPWGEHSIDYNIYETILGRESFLHAKFKETKAYWEGRRDEVVASYKRDYVELAEVLGMDLLTVTQVPGKDYRPKPMKQLSEDSYLDENGEIWKVSSITGDLMKFPLNTAFVQRDMTYEEAAEMAEQAKLSGNLPVDPNISEYEVINHVVEKLGKTHFVIAPINGIEWPRFGASEEDSWVNLLLEPETCEKLAEYQYWNTIHELDRLAATGIDGVLSVGDLGNTTNLAASPALYREITLKYHQKIYQACKERGLYVLRHCCGHVWPIIEDLADNNDAYEGIQEYAGMDILKLKERVGDRLCLWGGVLHEHIHGGTPEQVREDARRAILGAGQGGGLILGSSHSLTIGATYDNIMAMKKAREDFGVYPLKY